MPANQSLDFKADEFRSLSYTVIAYHGGVAIRADAQVMWAPRRSPADTVPASVTSAEVLVVRQNPQMHQRAPTVRRTLTGDAVRALANFVNRLPRAIPTFYVGCPASVGRWFDQVVFHSSGPIARLLVNLLGCASATFTIGQRKPIELSLNFSAAIANIDHRVLSVVGLPANYGH